SDTVQNSGKNPLRIPTQSPHRPACNRERLYQTEKMGHIFESSANNSMGEDASALGALIDRSVPGWRHMCQSTGRPLGCEDMMPLAESSSSVEAPTPRCHCGVRSPIRTAWKCDYPGRRFYGCSG
ncbi:hypothetical protein S245_002492, partial [Arachis hypogaea]